MINKTKKLYLRTGQYIATACTHPSAKQGRVMLFLAGTGLLVFGVADIATAQAGNIPDPSQINYNDARIIESLQAVLAYIEGAFGALVMIAAGLGAIVSAAFGQYSAALGLFVVAVGAFILRSLVVTFFNTVGLEP
jgi:hypothetical protein